MARGLPLVTSREGASGLVDLDGHCLLIADDWDTFARHLEALVEDHAECSRLGENAANYVRRHLSHEACFAPLYERLVSLQA